MEKFYFEHHWANMSYWLWCAMLAGLVYTAISLAMGDEIIAKAFDVRMDHYTRPEELHNEYESRLSQDATNSTASNADMFNAMRAITVREHTIKIPRAGFLAWHVTWCLLFLSVLLLDRMQHRCTARIKRGWIASRAWVAFAIMFIDLLITSFLNPSVARFMMFVYALLIRACFTQVVVLVTLASAAMLSAGYVGSHDFLGSVSVAEFLILNLICVLASRQIEMNARLSLYRLWYIMASKGNQAETSPGSGSLSRKLLSLDELEPIMEMEELDMAASVGSREEDIPGTPSSYTMSVRSVGSEEPSASALPLPVNLRAGSSNVVGKAASAKRSRSRLVQEKRKSRSNSHERLAYDRAASPVPDDKDKDSDSASECLSFHSELVWESCRAPPWLCVESNAEFPQSVSGDFADLSTWAEVTDVDRFQLRGPTYLEDRKKVPASPCAFTVHIARCFRTQSPLYNVAGRLPSLKSFIASHPKHFFLVYNRIVPNNGTMMNVVLVMVRSMPVGEDRRFDAHLKKFVEADNEYRNLRLKHLCSMREAPSAVTNAIWLTGGEKPVIIGKGYLDQQHYLGPNYLEVDVDISPSRMAKAVVGKVLHHGKKVVMEEMLVIEGQSPEELPERPLAAWRWTKIDVPAVLGDLDESLLLDAHNSSSLMV